MKNKKVLLILVIVFVLVLVLAGVLYNRLSEQVDTSQVAAPQPTEYTEPADIPEEDTQAEAVTAPDFTVLDRQGNSVNLSDFFGRPIVLNFWASWCGPCKSEMPDFDEAYAQYGEEIHFLMVNMTDGARETIASATAYIEDQGYSFPIYFDTEYSAAIAYGASSLPTTFFINAEGSVIAYAIGALDSATLQQGIGMIYAPQAE